MKWGGAWGSAWADAWGAIESITRRFPRSSGAATSRPQAVTQKRAVQDFKRDEVLSESRLEVLAVTRTTEGNERNEPKADNRPEC